MGIFSTLLFLLPSFNAYSQTGDLALMGVTPVQSAIGVNALAEGKKTVIKTDIASLFPDMPVVIRVSPYYDGFPVGSEDYTIKVRNGSHSYYLPPVNVPVDHLVPKGSEFCVTVIIDPFNTIPEKYENDNTIKNVCLPIKDTKPLTVLYVRLIMPNDDCKPDERNQDCLTLNEMRNHTLSSSWFLKATYPIAEDEFFHREHPFTVEVEKPTPTPTWGTGDDYGVISKLDSMFGVPEAEHLHIVGVFAKNVLPGSGSSLYDLSSPSVLVDINDTSGMSESHEIAHTYGWVDPAHGGDTARHFDIDARGYWIDKRCEMGFNLPARAVEGEGVDIYHSTCLPTYRYNCDINNQCKELPVPPDFMAGNVQNNPDYIRWISKPTFEYLLDKFSSNVSPFDPRSSSVQPLIKITGIIFSNGTGEIFPWLKLNGTAPDIPLNNPGNLTISYLSANGTKIAQTGFNAEFRGIADIKDKSSEAATVSKTIPDVKGTSKIVVSNGTKLVFERLVSVDPPHVRVITPKGGEVFNIGDVVDVTWNTTANKNSNVTHGVSLSQDNGTTWYPILLYTKNNSYSFTLPENINNTKSALIKVTANDGINIAEGISNSTFNLNRTLTAGSLKR